MAQSACNLISRFVIWACLIFNPIFFILTATSLAACSRSTHSMHLAILRTWVIIFFMYWWSSERMDFKSTTHWWSIHSLLPSSRWVSWVRPTIKTFVIDDVSSKFILGSNHSSHSWLIAVSSSLNPRPLKMSLSSLPKNSSRTSTNRWVHRELSHCPCNKLLTQLT